MANEIGGKFIRTTIRWLFLAAIAGSVLLTLVGGGVFWYFSRSLPNIITMEDYRPAIVTQVIAVHDEPSKSPSAPEPKPSATAGAPGLDTSCWMSR